MNVYDFDKTIYDGDSTLDYFIYSIKKQPTLISYLPKQVLSMFLYKIGNKSKLEFKQDFYGFLKYQKNKEEVLNGFWNEHQGKIKEWYKNQQKESDLIISASPEFLLKEICKREGIKHLIASKVNQENGVCESENCYGEEKVLRYRETYGNEKIEAFYSDSKSDQPIADIAEESYLVDKNMVTIWI